MTQQNERHIIKTVKNWNLTNILTVIGLFGGSLAYVNNRYERILQAVGQNATDNQVIKTDITNTKDQLQDVKGRTSKLEAAVFKVNN